MSRHLLFSHDIVVEEANDNLLLSMQRHGQNFDEALILFRLFTSSAISIKQQLLFWRLEMSFSYYKPRKVN